MILEKVNNVNVLYRYRNMAAEQKVSRGFTPVMHFILYVSVVGWSLLVKYLDKLSTSVLETVTHAGTWSIFRFLLNCSHSNGTNFRVSLALVFVHCVKIPPN